MTGRQKRCTSRAQAFCSSAVPLRCGEICWAEAEVEIDSEMASTRKNFCILFFHSDGREFRFPTTLAVTGTDHSDCTYRGMQHRRREAPVNAAKFTAAKSIYGMRGKSIHRGV